MQPNSAAAFFELIDASPDERAAIAAIDVVFMETAAHTNLVAGSTLPERWFRHYADSAQLWPLIPKNARSLLDIGAGGGFPGLILGTFAEFRRPDLRCTLCESIQKKAAFLREAAKAGGLSRTSIAAVRVEALPKAPHFDVITARAVTALPKLLDLAVPKLSESGTLLFPKGRRAQQELDQAREQWSLEVEMVPSATDPDASILVIRSPKRIL
ncbi:MAG: 16S rRNA (guanine(527)-N(7))-methyltransferase RsmG [Pseudomonadota bacterium]